MTSNPFSLKQIQVLEIKEEHNPRIDIKNQTLIITALIDNVDTIIKVPVSATLTSNPEIKSEDQSNSTQKVSSYRPAKRRRQYTTVRSMPGGDKRLGEMNGMAKLTKEQVIEIRQILSDESYLRQMGTKTRAYQEIAPLYNVSASCIMLIDTKRTWKHVTI